MSVIAKREEFDLVEQAVKTGTAPAEIVDAFNELSASREQLKKFGEPESYYLKAMNCPHHHRIFAAQPRSYRDLPLRLAEVLAHGHKAPATATSSRANSSASCVCARST